MAVVLLFLRDPGPLRPAPEGGAAAGPGSPLPSRPLPKPSPFRSLLRPDTPVLLASSGGRVRGKATAAASDVADAADAADAACADGGAGVAVEAAAEAEANSCGRSRGVLRIDTDTLRSMKRSR